MFELSKCAEPGIRSRIVSHLINIDTAMAQDLADRLGLATLPAPAPAAMPTQMDPAPSNSLSIALNPPASFKGRVIGVLVSDGTDATLLADLRVGSSLPMVYQGPHLSRGWGNARVPGG